VSPSSALRSTIETELRSAAIPGGSVAYVDRDGNGEALSVGLADVRQSRPATPETGYHLFSGTKLYTATAVMQLVENDRVALDAPAATYLPDVLPMRQITVRHLLSHTSGLRDTLRAFIAVHGEGETPPSTAVALGRYTIRANRSPGERVEYRNVNYALLGELVTRVSGEPYARYVADHVLAPLAMPVAFTRSATMHADMATGYLGAWEPLRFMTPFLLPHMQGRLLGARVGGLVELRPMDMDSAAIGGLVGAVTGFLPFVRSQLTGGAPVLQEQSVRQMQTLVARGVPGIASRVGMGLGWKLGEVDGTPFLNHEGGGPGFTSETRLYPSEGLGIVVCVNRWRAPTRSHLVAHRVCEAVRKHVTS
jgi:CubicO group peptidase (beta-lactamase class C family)